jgi:hypothetical protein
VEILLHRRQLDVLNSTANEILYGGAAGGGKSFLLRALAVALCYDIKGLQVYLFRRTYPDLIANHMNGYMSFPEMLAPFIATGQASIVDGECRFSNGSKIHLCHAQHEKDVLKYQGAEIHVLLIDELTHFGEYMYRFLRNRVRLGGLPISDRWKHKLPMILCGANPGGVGHTWVKRSFIDMAEPYAIRSMPASDGGMMRQYIPARLDDNPTLQKNDPGYLARLSGLGSDDLVRAMRDGDWDIVAGAAFEHLSRDTHMLRQFEIPEHWTKFTSVDWGSSKPYAVGWFAVVGETLVLKARDHWPERVIGKGSIVMYREMYGWNGKPDEGSREESWQVSDRMCGVEKERVNYRIGDSAMWAEHDGPSIAERMMQRLRANGSSCFVMEKSRKDRQANYQEMRNRIKLSDGESTGFYAMENCFHFWRTVPELQLDERQPEKGPDSDQEDHIWDSVAYAIASRPVVMDKITWTNEQYDIARDKAFEADRGGHKRRGRYG